MNRACNNTLSVEKAFEDMVLNPEVAKKVAAFSEALNRDDTRHLLVEGKPGVGKTMLALRLGKASGFNTCYLVSSVCGGYHEDALDSLETYLNTISSKWLFIIEDADLLMRNRADATHQQKALFELLLQALAAKKGTIVIVAVTSRPEQIDPEFLKLCDRIELPEPSVQERRALLVRSVDTFLKKDRNLEFDEPSVFSFVYWFGRRPSKITRPTIALDALTDDMLDMLACKLEGARGRDIFKFIWGLQSAALGSEENCITAELVQSMLKEWQLRHTIIA